MKAVAVGGGHGLSRALAALARIADHVTAVVTTADDGGSSGRLRRTFGVVPPGDMRMALASLARRGDLSRLLQYRFAAAPGSPAELADHSLGNLLIVALTDLHDGDVVAALEEVGELLEVPGRVLPCTTQPVRLHARLADGEVSGQAIVARSQRVEQVWLEPTDPPATPQATAAVAAADLVVLGPGSLYTSLLPNLLVPGIAAAVAASSGPVVHVTNLREQRGETRGMDLTAHLTALTDHAPGLKLAAVIAHAGPGPPPLDDLAPLRAQPTALSRFAEHVAVSDVADPAGGHHPGKLAAVLEEVLAAL